MGGLSGVNVVNPVLKDTVHIPSGGYVVIRYYTDNPGGHDVTGFTVMGINA